MCSWLNFPGLIRELFRNAKKWIPSQPDAVPTKISRDEKYLQKVSEICLVIVIHIALVGVFYFANDYQWSLPHGIRPPHRGSFFFFLQINSAYKSMSFALFCWVLFNLVDLHRWREISVALRYPRLINAVRGFEGARSESCFLCDFWNWYVGTAQAASRARNVMASGMTFARSDEIFGGDLRGQSNSLTAAVLGSRDQKRNQRVDPNWKDDRNCHNHDRSRWIEARG